MYYEKILKTLGSFVYSRWCSLFE